MHDGKIYFKLWSAAWFFDQTLNEFRLNRRLNAVKESNLHISSHKSRKRGTPYKKRVAWELIRGLTVSKINYLHCINRECGLHRKISRPCRIDSVIARSIRQVRGLRFSRKDRTFEVNELFIICFLLCFATYNSWRKRHDNLVSTLTLTRCDPPLKNPDYAPDNALELANQSSRYIGCKHKPYNNTFYSGFVFCEKFITMYKHNWDNNGQKAATGWQTHEHPAGWMPEEDSHMKR